MIRIDDQNHHRKVKERPKDTQPTTGIKEGRELVHLVVGFIIRFIITYNK
jgi:hypothetical protein